MRGWVLGVCCALLVSLGSCGVRALSSSCFCDVSSGCDAYCCCDGDCPVVLKDDWNGFALCASDGYAIPLCSTFASQGLHSHDLYQGLRMIYTIVKRLFCISKVNFVDPAKGFTSTTSDAQISLPDTTASVIHPGVVSLANVSAFSSLPIRNGLGTCGQWMLRDMNSLRDGECRVLLSSAADLATNPFLSLTLLKSSNNINGSLQIFAMTTPATAGLASTPLISNCVGTTCMVVKQVKLFFVKSGSSVSLDYSSSYVVMGNTVISAPTYVHLRYSYQFVAQAGAFPFTSSVGYGKGSPLVLLKNASNSTTATYYRMQNPVNLAFINLNGICRADFTTDADHSNLISFRFGVNAVYTCSGSSTIAASNLKQAFNMVGSTGSASTLADFVTVDYSLAAAVTNQNVQLVFYYTAIGTQASPQYQIVKAVLNPLTASSNAQYSLFVEYVPVSTSVVLNLPSPPVIDAYLPDDFLYPFYVA